LCAPLLVTVSCLVLGFVRPGKGCHVYATGRPRSADVSYSVDARSLRLAGGSPAEEVQQPADDTQPECTQDEGPPGRGGLSGGLCGLRLVLLRLGLSLSLSR